jgi:hypothetical protein
MKIPASLCDTFPPSDERLLDVTRRQMDDEMLSEIAAADYGTDLDAHLAALRPIRDGGWQKNPRHESQRTHRIRHLARLVSCKAFGNHCYSN